MKRDGFKRLFMKERIGVKRFKKCIYVMALILSAVLVDKSQAIDVRAAVSGDWKYEILEDGSVEISSYLGTATDVTIPATINEKKVTSIGDEAFCANKSVTNITIPNGVTRIGIFSFWCCDNLTNVNIPNSVTSIAFYAFYGSDNLKSLIIPKSVTEIDRWAFSPDIVLSVVQGSYAETYAKENDHKYIYVSDTSVTVPKVSKVKKFDATAKKKGLTLTWKKVSGAKGYKIQVSTKKNFKGAKSYTVSKSKKKYTISDLKEKKKYYIRICAYKTYKDTEGKTQKVYGKYVTINKKTK